MLAARAKLFTAGGVLVCLAAIPLGGMAAEKTENFDRDPGWDGFNNRVQHAARTVKQDFGYSRTSHCGSGVGEVGGFIQPAAEAAYYGKAIARRSLNDALTASGKFVAKDRNFNALIGFFNSETLNDWRTPNTIAIRVYGRGDVFYAYAEYATAKWRAGAAQFETNAATHAPTQFPANRVFEWTLKYDPQANGSITASIGDQIYICRLEPGHKFDGATFNRFGLLNVLKSYDGGGEIYIDDVVVNGEHEGFDSDPHWEGFHNRGTFMTRDVRPWFDFGYTNTHFAGGQRSGELGGVIFRGDGRSTNMIAFYGDRLEAVNLTRPLRARGKVSFCRGVSDSDTLIGFFHAEHSIQTGGTDRIGMPQDFLGVRIGGPSRQGFYFSPAYRTHAGEQRAMDAGPLILPDGASHDWSLEYVPNEETGSITVALDGQRQTLAMLKTDRATGAHFNRFGIITTLTDGNGQRVYFDDLTYTFNQ